MVKSDRTVEKDALRSVRRASRSEEISEHGRPINYYRVFRDRKKYYRKRKHKNRWEY